MAGTGILGKEEGDESRPQLAALWRWKEAEEMKLFRPRRSWAGPDIRGILVVTSDGDLTPSAPCSPFHSLIKKDTLYNFLGLAGRA